jgi:hypothetical protein
VVVLRVGGCVVAWEKSGECRSSRVSKLISSACRVCIDQGTRNSALTQEVALAPALALFSQAEGHRRGPGLPPKSSSWREMEKQK